MITMNMQNKLYTIQFYHRDDRLRVSPWAAIAEPRTHRFCILHKTPENNLTPREDQTPRQEKQGKKDSCPLAKPQSSTEHDIYGMEYFHWPAWASCLAILPLSYCTLAHELNRRSWKKSMIS